MLGMGIIAEMTTNHLTFISFIIYAILWSFLSPIKIFIKKFCVVSLHFCVFFALKTQIN